MALSSIAEAAAFNPDLLGLQQRLESQMETAHRGCTAERTLNEAAQDAVVDITWGATVGALIDIFGGAAAGAAEGSPAGPPGAVVGAVAGGGLSLVGKDALKCQLFGPE